MLRGKIKLPKYQRRLVWSKNEKREFIETLHNGFPFGSILLYKYGADENDNSDRFTLIDGLQRYSTMMDFESNPSLYYPIKGEFLQKVLSILFDEREKIPQATMSEYEAKISAVLREVVISLDDSDTFYLRDQINSEFSNMVTAAKGDELTRLQGELISDVKSYLNIDNVDIPYIEFLGDETQLAEVFSNLNRGGKKLTKYQVFAAQWYGYTVKLSEGPASQELLDNVIHRYDSLISDRELEIVDYDPLQMQEDREINLSEFCGALGSLIVSKNPALFFGKSSETGELKNVVGFTSAAIALKVDNRKLHELVNKADLLKDEQFVERLTNEVLNIYKDINDTLKQKLRKPGVNDAYESSAISDFQVISMFASLWTIKYRNLSDVQVLEPTSHYMVNYDKARRNFIFYLLFDAVTGYWSGTGDSKIAQIYVDGGENRYLRSLDRQRLENALIEWHSDEVERPSINIGKVQKLIVAVFTSYYACTLNEQRYEYEHILTRRGFLDQFYKRYKIPGGAIGNIMFLDLPSNRGKGLKTLYEYEKEGQSYCQTYLERALYPTKDELEEAKSGLESALVNPAPAIRLISSRGSSLINSLLNNMYS